MCAGAYVGARCRQGSRGASVGRGRGQLFLGAQQGRAPTGGAVACQYWRIAGGVGGAEDLWGRGGARGGGGGAGERWRVVFLCECWFGAVRASRSREWDSLGGGHSLTSPGARRRCLLGAISESCIRSSSTISEPSASVPSARAPASGWMVDTAPGMSVLVGSSMWACGVAREAGGQIAMALHVARAACCRARGAAWLACSIVK